MPNITPPSPTAAIVMADGSMTQEYRDWTQEITLLDIIIGTGSPEAVVIALVGQEYMDDAGVAGAIKYIKRDADIAGDRSKGWILI